MHDKVQVLLCMFRKIVRISDLRPGADGLLQLPGHDDVYLGAAGAEDVPRLLHRHAAQTRPVHVDDLVSDQEPAIPATSGDLKRAIANRA